MDLLATLTMEVLSWAVHSGTMHFCKLLVPPRSFVWSPYDTSTAGLLESYTQSMVDLPKPAAHD